MSAIIDNKNFLTGVLSNQNPNFDISTFGLWFSYFKHVNFSENGYSLFEPLIEDVVLYPTAVTGKKFPLTNRDGKYARARFFITSGMKGLNSDEPGQLIAEITDSFISGSKPLISIPDTDFPGKVFRRYEITGTTKSQFTNKNLLLLSGEDWHDSQLLISGNATSKEYQYLDTGYSGYSNEVITRYKFLYDDKENSSPKRYSSFDVPIQLEPGSSLKYRIAKQSDPLGTFFTAQIAEDGKAVLDYKQHGNESSGKATSSITYDFSSISKITFTPSEISAIKNTETSTRAFNGDASVTGLKIEKFLEVIKDVEYDNLQFTALTSGDYSGVYKLNIATQYLNISEKSGVVGYVMSGYSGWANGVNTSTNIISGSEVYYSLIRDGLPYTFSDFYTDQEMLGILNDQKDTVPRDSEEEAVLLSIINFENKESLQSLKDESETPSLKTVLPNFALPKKSISSDYYSNYQNSGETYIAMPIGQYNSNQVFVNHGNKADVLGFISNSYGAFITNSTCGGINIDEVDFCKGDSAIYSNAWSQSVWFEKGSVTQIPPNGIIKKSNYTDKDSWLNAINYFYIKNYIITLNLDPSDPEENYESLLNEAIRETRNAVGGPAPFDVGDNGFVKNNGNSPRLFVERRIYVEPYNQDQISEFNRSLNSGVKIANDSELTTDKNERLYCVQSYGDTPDSDLFSKIHNRVETLKFEKFLRHDDSVDYSTGELRGFVDFNLTGIDPTKDSFLYRVESVTGSGSFFSYNNYGNNAAWTGVSGQAIGIVNQNIKNYAYHLYSSEALSGSLTFVKSNVTNNEISHTPKNYAVVLKFSKKDFTDSVFSYKKEDDGGFSLNNSRINASIIDSSLNLVDANKVKINIQIYDYKLKASDAINHWSIFKSDPINDNQYGSVDSAYSVIPRFFEESLWDEKTSPIIESFYTPPNGPYTSKNYQGSTVSNLGTAAPLIDGLFENTISITEESKNILSYESNCVLDFVENDNLTKQRTPKSNNSVSFKNARRLKITKVKYDFYTKNLLIVGDAGSPYSTSANDGWQYELLFRKIGEENFRKVRQSETFSKDEIVCRYSSLLDSFYYTTDDLKYPHYLATVMFAVNLPLYLDDKDYEFKIEKYEKLSASPEAAAIIKKTNFIPIQVSWTDNPKCSRFDIYQKDTGNNLKLLKTESSLRSLSYAVPDVKQQYIDLGLANFGSLNYSGYYDIVVSGIIPSVGKASTSLSGEYGFLIGDSDAALSINKITNLNTVTGVVPVVGVTYSPMLNFNNPESKNSTFEINQNHNGYYFVTDSATGTLNGITGQVFEAYVANTGSSSCSVGGATLSGGYVAAVSGTLPIVTSGLQVLDSAFLSLDSINDNDVIYLKNNFDLLNAANAKTFYLINDSASVITGSYNLINYSFTGGKTFFMTSTASALTTGLTLSNVNIQDDYIYSNTALTNFNHSKLTLSSAVTNVPIYNVLTESLLVNDSLTLNPDSFNFVTWNGVGSPTKSQKNYFDSIKIYLKGSEDNDVVTLLKDDTEIIITNFLTDSPEGGPNTYYFLKDESIARNFNIKIINGLIETLIPSQKQDFKLTVIKNKRLSEINFKIFYPSASPSFQITEDREQFVILSNAAVVNLDNLENELYQNSFVYFINKGIADASFIKGKETTAISQNQIAQVYLKEKKVEITILKTTRNHFKFDIDPATHLNSPINILNLDFCGTEINFPKGNVFGTGEAFLICKNRLIPNKINQNAVRYEDRLISTKDKEDTEYVNELNDLASNSMFLNAFVDNNFPTYPTVRRTDFIKQNSKANLGPIIPNETAPEKVPDDYFYIAETGLSSFTLRDFYNRKSNYNGKIFLSSGQQLSIKSFDEKNNIDQGGDAFSFNYSPDGQPNGRLTVQEDLNTTILSYESEKGSGNFTFNYTGDSSSDSICANLAYNSISVTGTGAGWTSAVTVVKNRLLSLTPEQPTKIFPIYNKDEFFVSDLNETKHTYYSISYETDVNSIIIPTTPFIGRSILIENNSSRSYFAKTSNNAQSFLVIPNSGIKLNFNNNNGWTTEDFTTEEFRDSNNTISTTAGWNQRNELYNEHPFGAETLEPKAFFAPSRQEGGDSHLSAFYRMMDRDSEIYGMSDADSRISQAVNPSKSIYCYGRRSKQIDSAAPPYNFINSFYTFSLLNGNVIYENEFKNDGTEVTPLKVVKRQHIDLLKYFRDSIVNQQAFRNVIFIPIVSQLMTYYLPNLLQKVGSASLSLGSQITGKKIVFVNLVLADVSAPNRVVNCFTGAVPFAEEISDLVSINDVLVYTASATIWTKVTATSDIPVVETVYPTLKGVKGITAKSDPAKTDGNEMVYLSNFNKFYVGLNSFENGQYGDFYLYNSYERSIFIKEIGKDNSFSIDSSTFLKIFKDPRSDTFLTQPLSTSESSTFSSVSTAEPTEPKVKTFLKSSYPDLKQGSLIKVKSIDKDNGSFKTQLYKYANPEFEEVEIPDRNYATLDLNDLTNYAGDDKLFIFGSSRVNELNQSFEDYKLLLVNLSSLGNEKFYIHNATPNVLEISKKDAQASSYAVLVNLPSARTIEISSGGVSYMEVHSKGIFYINKDHKNINYLIKSAIGVFVDNLLDTVIDNNEVKQESVDTNILISMVMDLDRYIPFYNYIGFSLTRLSKLTSFQAFRLSDTDSLTLSEDLPVNQEIFKKLQVATIPGHYIINDNDSDIVVNVATFLVNNCVKDIWVFINFGSSLRWVVLYRNTVLVINSSGEIRYLKKAKRRDEFYCVFCPGTLVDDKLQLDGASIGGGKRIPITFKNVLPILDLHQNQQPSYIKLLPKSGGFVLKYLSVRDYYSGIDIPTDSPENVLAYEIGIGHETIYKFLFFDPSESLYMLPGIEDGMTYEVKIDSLFNGLKSELFEGIKEIDLEAYAYVKYDGKEYKDGETFDGKSITNYETKYPNYITVSKIVKQIEKTFGKYVLKNEEDVEPVADNEDVIVLDTESAFKTMMSEHLRDTLSTPNFLVPKEETVFWQDDNAEKDIWVVEQVLSSDSDGKKQITNAIGQAATFVKCSLTKPNIKTIIEKSSSDFYSALRFKYPVSNYEDLLIGLIAGLIPEEYKKIAGSLEYFQSNNSYLIPASEIFLGGFTVFRKEPLEISVTLSKLIDKPILKFEDFSKSSAVELINS